MTRAASSPGRPKPARPAARVLHTLAAGLLLAAAGVTRPAPAAPPGRGNHPVRAAQPHGPEPYAGHEAPHSDPIKIPFQNAKIHSAVEYDCDGNQRCSAGCGSASFSPVKKLTVVLLSVQREPNGAYDLDMLYYFAELQGPAGASAAKHPTRAEGFILNATSLCGTVNMEGKATNPADLEK